MTSEAKSLNYLGAIINCHGIYAVGKEEPYYLWALAQYFSLIMDSGMDLWNEKKAGPCNTGDRRKKMLND